MTRARSLAPPDHSHRRLVRPYTITRGRASAGETDLELEALVTLTASGEARFDDLELERHAIAAHAREPVSIAELAALCGVHLGVARVLVSDMHAEGLIEVHRAADDAWEIDRELLELVLHEIESL